MSTVKAVNFQHPSSSTPAITLDSTGAMTGSFPYPNRNLLYNGAMQVAQRGTSTAGITGQGYYTADRWNFFPSSFGTWTQSIVSDAPSGSGLTRSLKLLCTSSSSPSTSNYIILAQGLEGQDVQRIAKGTSSASHLTLSFWIKSNITNTYIVEMQDNNNVRSVSAQYSINAANTWERKIITFPPDAIGAMNNDNGLSLQPSFWFGSGTNYSSGTLPTTWGTTGSGRANGCGNLASSVNNYVQITGVQLETGSVATPFEFKSYAQELRECQRYYQKFTTDNGDIAIRAASTDYCYDVRWLPVTMRSAPTATHNWQSGDQVSLLLWGGSQTSQIDFNGTSPNRVNWLFVFGSYTVGRIYSWSTSGRYVGLSAEL